jgi:hypothetical protein
MGMVRRGAPEVAVPAWSEKMNSIIVKVSLDATSESSI